MITIEAYAKINLGLDVLRRLENGYHEVKMIMQMVDLSDTLTFELRNDKEIEITADTEKLPCDEHNLIYKAAKIFFEETGEPFGVSVHLTKRIPIAAGMAGGSTDAAATLKGLNQLAGEPLSLEKLQEIAVKIGADVPYCVMGGTALSEGIGEKLTKLAAPPETVLLIAKPDIDVSTAFVYQNLHLDRLSGHPDIDGMRKAIESGDLGGITDRLGNVLETVTIPNYPIIGQIKELCKNGGCEGTLMSGSGPTVFAIFTEKEKARRVAEQIQNDKLASQVFVTGFYFGEE